MATISTGMTTSCKQEFMQAGHNLSATATPVVTAASAATTLTSVSSLASCVVGASVTGTGIAANTVITRILSSNSIEISKATTAIISAANVTVSGDVFMVALIKGGFANNYSSTNVNYSDLGTDEVSTGGGYTQPGLALTNTTPTTGSGVAYSTPASNPSWSAATFSTAGCMIYNSSVRIGGTSGSNTVGNNRAVAVFDFGGVQQVNSGVFTITLPANASGTALLRIS